MRYKFLRKFLMLRDGENCTEIKSSGLFSCGIHWYYSIGGGMAICKGSRPDIHNVAFVIQVKDSSAAWRKRLDEHTRSADYDLTVRKVGAAL